MNLFFYGTLLDPTVLEAKTGRCFARFRLIPASLDGYRRVRISKKPYPMLVAVPGEQVEGLLMRNVDGATRARLTRYEGSLYGLYRVVVSVKGKRVPAMLFNARPTVRPSGVIWMPLSGRSPRSGRYRP